MQRSAFDFGEAVFTRLAHELDFDVQTVLVPDEAGVERIGQQAVEVSATERQPACPGSIRGEALLGAQPQTVRLGLHLPERSASCAKTRPF